MHNRTRQRLLRSILLLSIIGACGHPAPQAPSTHSIEQKLSCFIVESVGGNGLVCVEKAAVCQTIRGSTATSGGVTAISECVLANVTVDEVK